MTISSVKIFLVSSIVFMNFSIGCKNRRKILKTICCQQNDTWNVQYANHLTYQLEMYAFCKKRFSVCIPIRLIINLNLNNLICFLNVQWQFILNFLQFFICFTFKTMNGVIGKENMSIMCKNVIKEVESVAVSCRMGNCRVP